MAIAQFAEWLGVDPYPWQEALYDRFVEGEIPPSLAVPTGAGKTAAVPLYFLALAQGAPVPRRLVYVVDRRAIVDQTAEALRAWLARLADLPELGQSFDALGAFPRDGSPVPVGVLRGGLADSGDWRLDPARPAVIVGTVDMIGSRLLFAGYGDGRSRRATHAGLFGCDTTVMLDEAHLSPAMGHLLKGIEALQSPAWRPALRALTMSATLGGAHSEELTEADRQHPELGRRLVAPKSVSTAEAETPGTRQEQIAAHALRYVRGSVLVYVRTVADAVALHARLQAAVGAQADRVLLLTGTLRGHERARLGETEAWQRFRPDRRREGAEPPVYLVATAAGEVGIDIDADHAVMDLVPMDDLIQRLGRVNRAGETIDGTAEVTVVWTQKDMAYRDDRDNERDRYARACARTLELLDELDDAAPARIARIDADRRHAASRPTPDLVELSRWDVDLLAATAADRDPPDLDPYLHGLRTEPEPPDTQVVWRWDVADLTRGGAERAREVLSFYPPAGGEVLQAPTRTVQDELTHIVAGYTGLLPAILRDRRGRTTVHWLSRDESWPDLAYATILLPADAGGLAASGLIDHRASGPALDVADDAERCRYHVAAGDGAATAPDWADQALRLEIPLHPPDAEPEEHVWLVYLRRRVHTLSLDAEGDLSRLGDRAETITDHNRRVAAAVDAQARQLELPEDVRAVLAEAAAWHDVGKDRRVWQLAAGQSGAPAPMAKARRGVFRPRLLGGYRHEFGSLVDADRGLDGVNDNKAWLRDLTLHLIAAHHGHARPGFPERHQWDPTVPEAAAEQAAKATELRFAALQNRLGLWTLAWLEALLKCADAYVSAGGTVDDA